MLKDELDYFIANQDRLVTQYRGQILAIKDQKVLGAFASYLDAYREMIKNHQPGTFALQRCEPGPEAYTVTISSALTL